MGKLDGKVSIITGAGSGIGKAITILFASEGCKVVAADINLASLQILEKEIKTTGGEIVITVVNVTLQEDIDKMFKVAIDTYGTVDVLVNNAGIMDDFSPVGDMSDDVFRKVIDINLFGTFKATKKAVNIMLEKGSGIIVNMASAAGLFGARAGAAYTASKYGVVALTKNTAFIYAKKGIRCNAIAPGSINTNVGGGEFMRNTNIEAFELIKEGMHNLTGTAEPIAVAQVALFLASDDSSFVNGSVIPVDGGWTAY